MEYTDSFIKRVKDWALKEYANNQHANYKGHTFAVCDNCGFLTWKGSKDKIEGEVVLKDITVKLQPLDNLYDEKCEKCLEIVRRNPEVFRWVLNVFDYQTKDKKG